MSRSRIRRASAMPALGGDAGALDLLARGDLGLLEGLALGDLERLQRALALDAALVDDTVARRARARSTSCSATISAWRRALSARTTSTALAASAISRSRSAISSDRRRPTSSSSCSRCALDAVALDRELAGDLLALGLLAGLQLADLEDAAAGDLALLHLFLVDDAGLGERPLLGDPRLLGRLGGGDLRLLRLLLAHRPLAGELGALHRPADLDLALLLEAGIFALAVDLQHAPLGFEILVADLDHGRAARSGCASCGASRSSRSAWSGLRRRRRSRGRRIRGWSGRGRRGRRSRGRDR